MSSYLITTLSGVMAFLISQPIPSTKDWREQSMDIHLSIVLWRHSTPFVPSLPSFGVPLQEAKADSVLGFL